MTSKVQALAAGHLPLRLAPAGGRRHLRCALISGDATHARDRHPHGVGAQRSEIFRLIVSQGMKGLVLGLGSGPPPPPPFTRLLAGTFSGLLFGVKTTDPAAYALVAL